MKIRFAVITLTLALSASVAKGDASKAAVCVACHGVDGNSINPIWPNLAGQGAEYTVQQLNAFKTKKRNYVFVDAPGHKEFLRNMITGASSADIALLIIDAEEGVKEQTKKHVYLLKLLGISKVIVVMNKMDKIKYNQEKFSLVKLDITKYLNLLNINAEIIIPISARDGENVNNKSKKKKLVS